MFHVPLCRRWDGSGPDQQAPLSRGRAGCFDIVPTRHGSSGSDGTGLAHTCPIQARQNTYRARYGIWKRFEIGGTKTNRSDVNLHLVMHSSALFS